MPSALTIPGVQIRTLFEPAPVLPGATGILGVVGVTDRGPIAPTPLGSFDEFVAAFGEGSRHTMPEVRAAFVNGVSRVVIARTIPGGAARKASAVLQDEDGQDVALVEARAEGAWGNRISVALTAVRTLKTKAVRYIDVQVLVGGTVRETFSGLVMDPDNPKDFFRTINENSTLITAVDPDFRVETPKPISRTALPAATADTPASVVLKSGADGVVRVVAKEAGRDGERINVSVSEGRAGLVVRGPDNAESIDVVARAVGDDGTDISAGIATDPADDKRRILTVTPPAPGTPRTTSFGTVKELVQAMAGDPDVEVVALGRTLPEPRDSVKLRARRDVTVRKEGRDSGVFVGIPSLAALGATGSELVTFEPVEGTNKLPDATSDPVYLSGGLAAGERVLSLAGADREEPLLAVVGVGPADTPLAVQVRDAVAVDGMKAVDVLVFAGDNQAESHAAVTMDPDHPRYLPAVLAGSSQLIRAYDLFVPSRSASLPKQSAPVALHDGVSPDVEAYQDALDRLESAEEVDLVVASVLGQLDEAGVRGVHQRVVAHCEKMSDVARNRIGIGSVTEDEAKETARILDHADDVRSDHFVLTTPAGSEGSFAGKLGLQEYFQSPTFKTISALGVPAGQYTDAQLEALIRGNVVVINERRGLGVIVIKAILTSGRQINVQRTANKAVRDVKAVCDKYIGRLNNDGARIALRQQVIAMLGSMERDGALVPSTDGTSPAFGVAVFSTQADFANGIVNVDIAVRPVRAIDYIYGRILVQN
jgi:tail sheath protein